MIFKIISILLSYPDEEMISSREEIARAVQDLEDSPARESIERFLLYWQNTPPLKLQADYAETFDFAAKNTLYLSYFRYGDERRRGQALIDLKWTYAKAGYAVESDELPDYLPLMLEFANEDPETGMKLLSEYRAGLEVMRKALLQMRSPYTHLIDALRSLLPEVSEREMEEARELVAKGPPRELVGLEPYGSEGPQVPPQSNVVFDGRRR
ncbi:MAG: nitrate reductase molybdenum cofactor assembly chaperone [Rubrobacteraceae bacterium]|uniref:nitrate reductase molybdenum cofactor assembly chaperone n=1 Tax=Rubrobacter naiadicus TaxID=1392641 RepID=UPI00235FA6D0|nr:nitrate reductase molybdenum cofactor assembly chaperone [Rubrobacter naiadicus]MCL6439675.1 nitrate reductase molybdenum cofactor assembly chaperone [Rubrobacteraceae bacterium]